MGKRIGIYLVGLAVAALGIALIILSLLGAGPWDSVAVGLTNYFGLTIGTWSIISQLLFTLVTWIIEKTRFRIEISYTNSHTKLVFGYLDLFCF